MRQNDSERPKFWNLGDFWSCPKFWKLPKSQWVPFGACYWNKWVQTWHAGTWRVNLPFCWTWSPKGGLRVKKVASEAKNCPKSQRYWPNSQWSLSGLKLTWKLTWNFWLEIDQKVNGIDQIVNDWHKKWIRIGPSGLNRIESDRIDWNLIESNGFVSEP